MHSRLAVAVLFAFGLSLASVVSSACAVGSCCATECDARGLNCVCTRTMACIDRSRTYTFNQLPIKPMPAPVPADPPCYSDPFPGSNILKFTFQGLDYRALPAQVLHKYQTCECR